MAILHRFAFFKERNAESTDPYVEIFQISPLVGAPISPDLFMKIGTRVGSITAYYRHIYPVVKPKPILPKNR